MTDRTIRACVLILFIISVAVAMQGEDVSAARERMRRVVESSSLDTLTAHPWHARLSLTLFDSAGKNPTQGTVDYWKSGEDWLRVITVGSDVETHLRHDGHSYHSSIGDSIPYVATELMQEFVHPSPSVDELDHSSPELRKQTLGQAPLDCVMLSQPMKGVASIPLGLFPTYCMDRGTDLLRVAYALGGHQFTANRIGRFLEHNVPTEATLAESAVVVATAKVASLATFAPGPDTFLPTSSMTSDPAFDIIARIASGVTAGLKLKGEQPRYPEAARLNHISGTVVLRAIIDRDGRVRSLQLKSANDPDLALAAIAAVRTWTYKPYLLNGVATEVDTTVIVNFNLNPY